MEIKKKIVAIGGAVAVASSCSTSNQVAENDKGQEYDGLKKNGVATDSESLVKRLKALATADYDTFELPNAMCYSVAMPIEENYVCPKCGAKTASTTYKNGNVRSIRGIVAEIKAMGYDVVLDESQYCHKCNGSKEEYPELRFKIRFSKDAEYHVAGSNTSSDYSAVKAFFEGEKVFREFVANNRDEAKRTLKIVEKMTGLKTY